MLLGALLHAGLALEELREALHGLGLEGVTLTVERQVRHGISGFKFVVAEPEGARPARNLPAIREIVQSAGLSERVVQQSLSVFEAIAHAESEVHSISPEEVHFHEIGAVDSLVDVVGFCWGLERLGLEKLYSSPLPIGGGAVTTEHGLLPLPAPATLALLAAHRVPVVLCEVQAELVTPTGAALLSTCASFERPALAVERVGYGFGAKEFPWANVLRLWIGTPIAVPCHLPKATSIGDLSGEQEHHDGHSARHGEH